MGRLVKIGFPYHNLDCTSELEVVRPSRHNGPNVRSQDRLSTLTSFREPSFSPSLSTYSPTPKANKGFLGPPNTNYNLYATK